MTLHQNSYTYSFAECWRNVLRTISQKFLSKFISEHTIQIIASIYSLIHTMDFVITDSLCNLFLCSTFSNKNNKITNIGNGSGNSMIGVMRNILWHFVFWVDFSLLCYTLQHSCLLRPLNHLNFQDICFVIAKIPQN